MKQNNSGRIRLVVLLIAIIILWRWWSKKSLSEPLSLGDSVTMDFTIRTQDGKIFDTTDPKLAPESINYDPKKIYQAVSFTLWSGMFPAGLETKLVGLKVWDNQIISLATEEAYGSRKDQALQTIPVAFLAPLGIEIKPGVEINDGNGLKKVVALTGENNELAIIDANHALAGQSVVFEVIIRDKN